jgi:hypothetical protein
MYLRGCVETQSLSPGIHDSNSHNQPQITVDVRTTYRLTQPLQFTHCPLPNK